MIAPGEPRIDGDRALEEIAREGGAWRVVLNGPHGGACRVVRNRSVKAS